MLLGGFMPDRFTLSSVVSACAELGFVSVGQQLHSWVVKMGLCLDVYVGCSLLDMYAKCDTKEPMEDARKVVERMRDHNVTTWTAMITGYVQSGGLDRTAIELYCKMITQGDVFPNHFTYSSLLKACGSLSNLEAGRQIHNHAVKSGLVSVNCVGNSLISILLSAAASLGAVGKGEEIHARLVKAGLDSNQRVCNSLISMYSRCGDIEAAARVFDKMKERNVISWTSVITGYAKHGLAKSALEKFDQMLKAGVKPNEVTYIAVLSACSHVGMVDEGDTFHPRAHEIYKELDQLVTDIKKLGYVPDTDFVLHELDEKEKEQYLVQHSEKIAVAFGLISTSKTKPIRVFKNLRVCGDCHTAMKYISVARGREIVVRDSNRFHHFKNGSCSCNDYW
nr:hypothetical protein [Tanacetum cinerariifolium]